MSQETRTLEVPVYRCAEGEPACRSESGECRFFELSLFDADEAFCILIDERFENGAVVPAHPDCPLWKEERMSTYAVADEVPADCYYLTAGKEYKTFNSIGIGFDIYADDGDLISCLWSGSEHLNGGNWRRVNKP